MKPDSNLLQRIKDYIEGERKDYWLGGQLLCESFDEIERLNKEIADMEKAFLLTKTHHD